MTIVLVTHLMDDVANYADYVNVLESGKLVRSGYPKEVFRMLIFLKANSLVCLNHQICSAACQTWFTARKFTNYYRRICRGGETWIN